MRSCPSCGHTWGPRTIGEQVTLGTAEPGEAPRLTKAWQVVSHLMADRQWTTRLEIIRAAERQGCPGGTADGLLRAAVNTGAVEKRTILGGTPRRHRSTYRLANPTADTTP